MKRRVVFSGGSVCELVNGWADVLWKVWGAYLGLLYRL